jgi:hypothetical protein
MLTQADIEAQLSYAYLHAVASHAGVACQEATRARDNAGIDATLHWIHDFGPAAKLTEISLHIQLKATVQTPAQSDGKLSYFLRETEQYDRLRTDSAMPPRIMAVLFLPANHAEWLHYSPERLVLQHGAYWVSLVDAPPSMNKTGQTIRLPRTHQLSPSGLQDLFRRLAHQEKLRYAP